MELLFGFIIGFCYSLLAVTNMILATRYTLIGGIKAGIAAVSGNIAAQIIWAVAGVLFLGLFGFHAGNESIGNPAYFVIPGFIIILYMAYKVYTAPMPNLEEAGDKYHFGAFLSMFVVAISRPIRAIGYAGLYMLCGAHIEVTHYLTWLPLVVGVVIGVMIYWLGIVIIVSRFREKVTPHGIYRFSKIGAFVIVGIGLLSLISLV